MKQFILRIMQHKLSKFYSKYTYVVQHFHQFLSLNQHFCRFHHHLHCYVMFAVLLSLFCCCLIESIIDTYYNNHSIVRHSYSHTYSNAMNIWFFLHSFHHLAALLMTFFAPFFTNLILCNLFSISKFILYEMN